MKNINLIKKKEGNKFFLRNKVSMPNIKDEKILNLIKINSIKANNILEIGYANGNKLNQYSKLCNLKSYGVDLSKAILDGKRRYKDLKLLNISSLEIDKIN